MATIVNIAATRIYCQPTPGGDWELAFDGSLTPKWQSGYDGPASTYVLDGEGDGYTFTIDPTFSYTPETVIYWRVESADTAGRAIIHTWSFTTLDTVAPVVTFVSPSDLSIDVAVSTDIAYDVTDDFSGIDVDTRDVWIKIGADPWLQICENGVYISGYSDVVDCDPPYLAATITVSHTADFPYDTDIRMRVAIKDFDGNELDTGESAYRFTTEIGDFTAPTIDHLSPTGIGVLLDAPIDFWVRDFESGVNWATLSVTVNGIDAVSGGVALPGFTLTTASVIGGKRCAVTHPDLPSFTEVSLSVAAEDNAGNAGSESWVAETAISTAYTDFGFLRGYTSTVGELLAGISGLRATRLTRAVSPGDTIFPVETTQGWPTPGKLGINGVAYRYTGITSGEFTGVYYLSNGMAVNGAKQIHSVEAGVLDLSRTNGALDMLRRAFLVDYAEDSDLDAVGRNLGIDRLEGVDDAAYRAAIRVGAYAPRGTLWAIEQLLTALVGAGNFEIVEDLVNRPCLVKIRLPSTLLISNRVVGKAYLEHGEDALATADDTVQVSADPLQVGNVCWKDESIATDCRTAKPSSMYQIEYPGQTPPGTQLWAYQGADESTEVLVQTGDSGRVEIQSLGPAYYRHLARVLPESQAECSVLLAIPTAGTLHATERRQVVLAIHDTERALAWGVEYLSASQYRVGFIDVSSGAAIGARLTLDRDIYYELGIRKDGRGTVHLLLDGKSVLTSEYNAFPATSDHKIEFGVLASGLAGQPLPHIRWMFVEASTQTDYWALNGAAGLVAAANPDRFDTGVLDSLRVGVDEGKAIEISGATVANAQGGYANGHYTIAAVVSSQIAQLDGPVGTGATVDSAHTARIALDRARLRYPDDLGKTVTLSGSTLGNEGTYTIVRLLQEGTLADLAGFSTALPEDTSVCEVSGATFVSELGLAWQLTPVFANDSGLSWTLSDAGSVTGDVLTLRADLPIATSMYPRVLSVLRSRVRSAQLLADADVANTPAIGDAWHYYPLYLVQPWSYLMGYVDVLTAAGVIVEFEWV